MVSSALDIPLTREESRPLIEAVSRGIISKRLSTRMPGDWTRQDASRNMKEVDDLHTSIPPPRTAVDEVDNCPLRGGSGSHSAVRSAAREILCRGQGRRKAVQSSA